MILVVDFGGSSVKYAMVGRNGSTSNPGKTAAPLDSPARFLDVICDIYRRNPDAEGLSISIPGYVDADTGMLVGSGAYSNLYGLNLIDLVHSRLDINVAVENDGRCGALAEAWMGALAGCRDGVVLILGSGVAGGIIKDGRIHAGKNLAAGEFSNYLVNPGQPNMLGEAVMNCAAFGLTYKLCKAKNIDLSCQDLAGNMLAVDRMFGARFPVFKEPPKKIRADGKQLAKWVKEGDPAAKRIYDEFLASLAFMIVNIQITYAPERVVIGGGLSRIENMLPDLQEELETYYKGTGFGPELRAEVVLSRYLDECNILGAAWHYMSRFDKTYEGGTKANAKT